MFGWNELILGIYALMWLCAIATRAYNKKWFDMFLMAQPAIFVVLSIKIGIWWTIVIYVGVCILL